MPFLKSNLGGSRKRPFPGATRAEISNMSPVWCHPAQAMGGFVLLGRC